MNKTLNYSPNFETTKRKLNQIKFIIFHYTGMKKESESIKRLTNIKSKVSCHYFIKNNGEIVTMVPDLYVAWHAGSIFMEKL
jgi:N-acetylmuramoyl-L-alanine amidase